MSIMLLMPRNIDGSQGFVNVFVQILHGLDTGTNLDVDMVMSFQQDYAVPAKIVQAIMLGGG